MTRVMLDEGVPRPLAKRLRVLGIDASEHPNDWKQLSNGRLLDAVEAAGFDVLISCDKSMQFQQNFAGRRLAILILPTNNMSIVLGLDVEIARQLDALEPGSIVEIKR